MKYSVITVDGIRVYSRKSIEEVLDLLNEGKMFMINRECIVGDCHKTIINPSHVSKVTETYIEKHVSSSGKVERYFFGATAEIAKSAANNLSSANEVKG